MTIEASAAAVVAKLETLRTRIASAPPGGLTPVTLVGGDGIVTVTQPVGQTRAVFWQLASADITDPWTRVAGTIPFTLASGLGQGVTIRGDDGTAAGGSFLSATTDSAVTEEVAYTLLASSLANSAVLQFQTGWDFRTDSSASDADRRIVRGGPAAEYLYANNSSNKTSAAIKSGPFAMDRRITTEVSQISQQNNNPSYVEIMLRTGDRGESSAPSLWGRVQRGTDGAYTWSLGATGETTLTGSAAGVSGAFTLIAEVRGPTVRLGYALSATPETFVLLGTAEWGGLHLLDNAGLIMSPGSSGTIAARVTSFEVTNNPAAFLIPGA